MDSKFEFESYKELFFVFGKSVRFNSIKRLDATVYIVNIVKLPSSCPTLSKNSKIESHTRRFLIRGEGGRLFIFKKRIRCKNC